VTIPQVNSSDESVVDASAIPRREDLNSEPLPDEQPSPPDTPITEDSYDSFDAFDSYGDGEDFREDTAGDDPGEYRFGSERKRKRKKKRKGTEEDPGSVEKPSSGKLSLETFAVVGGAFLIGLIISFGSLWVLSGNRSTTSSDQAATGDATISEGYGDDLSTVIQLAIADLEAQKYADFVQKIIPDSARCAMVSGESNGEVISQLHPESQLVVLMLADLKSLQTLEPEINGATAIYRLPPFTASGGFPAAISSPNAPLPRDREIRFSLMGGSWKFFDNSSDRASI